MRQDKASGLVSLPLVAGEDSRTAKRNGSNAPAGRRAYMGGKHALVLALIDPKPLTRRSILEALAKALPDYTTVAASSCEELLDLQESPPGCPQIVVVHTRSLELTDPWVQNTLEFVRLHLTGAHLVLLSDRDEVDDIVKALNYGVRGYIPTSVEAEVFFAALRLINAGGTFIPAHAVRSTAAKPAVGFDCKQRGLPNEIALTPRELSVVDLLREGKPNKLIAAELKMQESTVKVHVRNIFKKLQVGNRTAAAFMANRMLGQQPPTGVASPPQGSNGRPAS